ncbi:branched-chain amino acid ABC transporter permease, partial [Chloroflexota bacterium]
ESVGISVVRHKVLVFAISSFFAGVAGSLLAHYITAIYPAQFGFLLSVYALVYAWVGGARRFLGPIIGAAFLTLVSEPFRGMTHYETLFFAIVVMFTIVFLPEGIVTLPQRVSYLVHRIATKYSTRKTAF